MENFKIEQKLEQEKSRNCVLKLSFFRHANKETFDPHKDGVISQSSISSKGVENSQEVGKNLELNYVTKSKVSELDRTKETYDNIEIGAKEQNENLEMLKTRKDNALNPAHFSPAFIKEYRTHFDPLPENYSELSPSEQERIIEDGENKPMDYWLKRWDDKFDEESESAKEVAERVANRFVWYDKMINKFKNDSKVEMMNITHRSVIEPILVSCLRPPLENLEDAGGSLELLEGFDLEIATDNDSKKTYKVQFRGKDYELDWEKVTQLSQDYEIRKENNK